MARITFTGVSISFPVYNAKKKLFQRRRGPLGALISTEVGNSISVGALRGLDFVINDGDRIGIIGENGAGKSTLLRAIAGVYAPDSGSIEIVGPVTSLIDINLGINPEATGRENIFLRGALLGMGKRETSAKFQEIVDFSELGEFIEMPVRTYSSGMQMRLGFAISTAFQNEILIMDEWLAVGDENFRRKAQEKLNQIVGTSKILVVASHSQTLIENICTKVIWLESGRIKKIGNASKICQEYFGSAGDRLSS